VLAHAAIATSIERTCAGNSAIARYPRLISYAFDIELSAIGLEEEFGALGKSVQVPQALDQIMPYLDYNWIEGSGCAGEEYGGSNDGQE
jgi:hypothetical protein